MARKRRWNGDGGDGWGLRFRRRVRYRIRLDTVSGRTCDEGAASTGAVCLYTCQNIAGARRPCIKFCTEGCVTEEGHNCPDHCKDEPGGTCP